MRKFLAGLSWCLVLVYPFIVLFGLKYFSLQYIGVAFIALALLRIVLLRSQTGGNGLPVLLSTVLLLVAAHALLANDPKLLRFYPVAINAVMFAVFGTSLWRGPSFVERLARLSEPDLDAHAVDYTRKVTIAWCVFFVCNGLVAFYTSVYSSFDTWVIYNGGIAYLLIGVLFSIEWLIRRQVKRGHNGDA